MDALYVTTAGDEFGKTALKVLKNLGCRTKVLGRKESAPEGSVAVFTAIRKPHEKRPRYLRCSSVRLNDRVPEWAKTTPLQVGVFTTTDRKSRSGKGTFASALATLDLMYKTWDWTSGNPIPWADVNRDKNFKTGSIQLERDLSWRNSPASVNLIQRSRQDFTTCQRVEEQLRKEGG